MTGPIVVLGDALLDIDLVGRATRITPDAPALVVESPTPVPRPGGAGLAARIAAAQGHEVVLVAPIADDDAAQQLRETLTDVRLVALPWEGATPVKQRVRASDQTLLRLDYGDRGGAVGALPDGLASLLADASAVLVSDYARGALTAPHVRRALAQVPSRTPIVWDPHPRGARPLAGARLITPNRSEAAQLAAVEGHEAVGQGGTLGEVPGEAAFLVDAWKCTAVAVTLANRGALLSYGGDEAPQLMPAQPVAATDHCGAGDCFAVTAAAMLAGGAHIAEAVATAVEEAGRFVRDGGASGFVERMRLGDDSGTVVATSGCFDLLHAGHVQMLTAARALGDRLVVLLNSDDSVRRLKGPARPLVPQADRARVLAALACVDEVRIFDEDTPTEAIRRLRPNLWVKGGDYAGTRLIEETALAECGARAVVLPYLDGHSTTGLLEKAARRRATDQATERAAEREGVM